MLRINIYELDQTYNITTNDYNIMYLDTTNRRHKFHVSLVKYASKTARWIDLSNNHCTKNDKKEKHTILRM